MNTFFRYLLVFWLFLEGLHRLAKGAQDFGLELASVNPPAQMITTYLLVEKVNNVWVDVGAFSTITPLPRIMLTAVPNGVHTYAVKAINTLGQESPLNAPLVITVPFVQPPAPTAPGKLRITVAVETSKNGGATWEKVSTTVIPVINEQ